MSAHPVQYDRSSRVALSGRAPNLPRTGIANRVTDPSTTRAAAAGPRQVAGSQPGGHHDQHDHERCEDQVVQDHARDEPGGDVEEVAEPVVEQQQRAVRRGGDTGETQQGTRVM